MIFPLGQKMNLRTVQLTKCQFVDMSTMETPMWLEVVKEAGPLFGEYLQEALASKLARVLPNNCVLLPHDKAKTSLLIKEYIQFAVLS